MHSFSPDSLCLQALLWPKGEKVPRRAHVRLPSLEMAASGEVQSQLEQGFEVGGALRCSITSCCHWQGHPVLVQQLLAHEAILSPPFLWNVRKFFDDCSDGLL